MHWPRQFFVFAYESDGLDTVLGHVERLNNTQPIDLRIDLVCILDKGLIINLAAEGLQPIPMPNTKLISKPSSKALLTFYAVLRHLMGGQRTNCDAGVLETPSALTTQKGVRLDRVLKTLE